MYKPNQDTITLIKHFESLHDGDLKQIGLQPKMCPSGIWTEGYGRAMINPNGKGFLKNIENKKLAFSLATIKNEIDASNALAIDLLRYAKLAENKLGSKVWEKLNDNQKGAITSFTYNCGVANAKIWGNITLCVLGKMSSESLYKYWCNSIVTGNGKRLEGLVLRRKQEALLFLK